MRTQTNPSSTDRLLSRFERYVRIHTTSDESSSTFPSTSRQLDLARVLASELEALGLAPRLDENGYVYAQIPENLPAGHPARGRVPAVGFIAHMDTSPDAPGRNVKPVVHRQYAGGDIVLPGDPEQVIRVADTPVLAEHQGHDIITSDGTTLLGADDKAGIAEIMEAAERIVGDPALLHGPIWIAFTPDEEIGKGVDRFDLNVFKAKIAYTLDGETRGLIEKETFNAHAATYHLEGYNVHPGTAKDKMVNTLYAAAEIIRRLPPDARPETTAGRQPYLHPRAIDGVVDRCTIHLLVRAFETAESQRLIRLLESIRGEVQSAFPKTRIRLEVKESYLNMGPKVDEDPRIMEIALEACRRAGVKPETHAIRGGTDGARLSYMGVLTPNIFTGGANYHSVQEWVSLQVMEEAVKVIQEITRLWVERSAAGGRPLA